MSPVATLETKKTKTKTKRKVGRPAGKSSVSVSTSGKVVSIPADVVATVDKCVADINAQQLSHLPKLTRNGMIRTFISYGVTNVKTIFGAFD